MSPFFQGVQLCSVIFLFCLILGKQDPIAPYVAVGGMLLSCLGYWVQLLAIDLLGEKQNEE